MGPRSYRAFVSRDVRVTGPHGHGLLGACGLGVTVPLDHSALGSWGLGSMGLNGQGGHVPHLLRISMIFMIQIQISQHVLSKLSPHLSESDEMPCQLLHCLPSHLLLLFSTFSRG